MVTKLVRNGTKDFAIQLINNIPAKKMGSVIDYLTYIYAASAQNKPDKADIINLADEIRAGLDDVARIERGEIKAKKARDFLNGL